MENRLGKIQNVHFGLQDGRIGFSFTLGQGDGSGWGVCTQWRGHWHKKPDHAKWTTEQQINACGLAMLELADLLSDAKKENINQLVGVPVEATFDRMVLKEWRILKEVL